MLGSGLGIGVLLILAAAPRWGAPSLARRIAPYIRDITDLPEIERQRIEAFFRVYKQLPEGRKLVELSGYDGANVAQQMVAEAIEAAGLGSVDKRAVTLPAHIKSVGNHQAQVRLHEDVVAVVDLQVVAAKAKK